MNPFEQAFRAYTSRKGGNMHGRDSIRQQTFCYAIFPIQVDIQPSDSLTGGLALNLKGESGVLSAFILREVCANGMVAPYWFKETHHHLSDWSALPGLMDDTLVWIGEKGINQVANRYRRAMRRPINTAFWGSLGRKMMMLSIQRELLPAIQAEAQNESQRRSSYASLLKGRWEGNTNSLSLFDAINGITAVARDHRDPSVSWQLQQLGWSILFSQAQSDDINRQSSEATLAF